jgi:hypothetical protein
VEISEENKDKSTKNDKNTHLLNYYKEMQKMNLNPIISEIFSIIVRSLTRFSQA